MRHVREQLRSASDALLVVRRGKEIGPNLCIVAGGGDPGMGRERFERAGVSAPATTAHAAELTGYSALAPFVNGNAIAALAKEQNR